MKTILILDDMMMCHEKLGLYLRDKYKILDAYDTKTAHELIKQQKPDLIISDVELSENGDREGLSFIEKVSKEFPGTPILCMSMRNYRNASEIAGADKFIFKKELFNNISKYIEEYLER